MSVKSFNIGFILISVFIFIASGCSSTRRRQQTVSQEAKAAYFEQAAARIQYDGSNSEPAQYQTQSASQSTYAPVPPASRKQSSAPSSCCH